MRREGKPGKPSEVRVQFEPNRIERACLAGAYERVVPIIRRSILCARSKDGESLRVPMVRRARGVRI